MVLKLHGEVGLTDAVRRLRECANEARNVVNVSGGRILAVHQNDYLRWANSAEAQLRSIFVNPGVWEPLHGAAYWSIRQATDSSPRPIELINDELSRQALRLDAVADALGKLAHRAAAAPGKPAVLDTNVLLHFQPPEQVDWADVVGEPEVRLVVPLRVIEELDEKKYTAKDDLADRARRILSRLRSVMASTAGAPTKLRDGVTIEVPIDEGPRTRSADADQEILDACLDLRSAGLVACLVTGDTGLGLRASAAGIAVVPMPEKYLRRNVHPPT
jgi:hypothetical protein